MIHPDQANVSKNALKDKVANMFKSKSEFISIFGLKTKFGGGRSTGFALIYDSLEAKLKCDTKCNLKRDGLAKKPEYTRKMLKEMKGRMKKVRGKEKAKAKSAGGKKKKTR